MIQQPDRSERLDELLTVLANCHCRATLAYFQDVSDDVASVSDLAAVIPARDSAHPERVAHQLHHSTLPRLADAGAIDYDPGSRTARYEGHATLETLLDGISTCYPAERD